LARVAPCSAPSRTLRAGFAGAASGILDRACAWRSADRGRDEGMVLFRSNKGMDRSVTIKGATKTTLALSVTGTRNPICASSSQSHFGAQVGLRLRRLWGDRVARKSRSPVVQRGQLWLPHARILRPKRHVEHRQYASTDQNNTKSPNPGTCVRASERLCLPSVEPNERTRRST
jgi:hypothetical protein